MRLGCSCGFRLWADLQQLFRPVSLHTLVRADARASLLGVDLRSPNGHWSIGRDTSPVGFQFCSGCRGLVVWALGTATSDPLLDRGASCHGHMADMADPRGKRLP
jgi:hypothetical protein